MLAGHRRLTFTFLAGLTATAAAMGWSLSSLDRGMLWSACDALPSWCMSRSAKSVPADVRYLTLVPRGSMGSLSKARSSSCIWSGVAEVSVWDVRVGCAGENAKGEGGLLYILVSACAPVASRQGCLFSSSHPRAAPVPWACGAFQSQLHSVCICFTNHSLTNTIYCQAFERYSRFSFDGVTDATTHYFSV